MVFSSLTFLFYFLPAVLIAYFIRPDIKWRNGVLLAASLLFYAWGEPVWILCMLFSTFVNWYSARRISHSRDARERKLWLIAGVGVSAAALFVFKYAAFLVNNTFGLISASLKIKGPELPIGISFYTFQVITYTVDVYRGKARSLKKYSRLLLYVSCFPQLIAGPIVQYSDIKDQLLSRASTPDGFALGICRFMAGLGKKVIFANICGKALTQMPAPAELSLIGAWYAAFLYALQLYFDFSAYSDMAIGLGRVFGFTYKENFRYPYAADSVRDFWRRWHISLGSFFRDYVYIPLGGNRRGVRRTVINTMVVWGLTGLWHGAGWTFLVWGLYYGVILSLDALFLRRYFEKLPVMLRRAITFLLVLIGWVVFYHPTMGLALTHIGAMFGSHGLIDSASSFVIRTWSFFPLIAFAASLPMKNLLHRIPLTREGRDLAQGILEAACLVLCVLLLVGQSYNPFIYFQF